MRLTFEQVDTIFYNIEEDNYIEIQSKDQTDVQTVRVGILDEVNIEIEYFFVNIDGEKVEDWDK